MRLYALRSLVVAVLVCGLNLPALAQTHGSLPLYAKKRALVIGIDSYTQFPRLRFAVNDAYAFRDILTEHLGFEETDIVLLVDSVSSRTRPTAGNILGEIEDLANDPFFSDNDLFVLYFSGHGVAVDGEDYLLPSDVRLSTVTRLGVSLQDIVKRLAEMDLTNILIVVDACRTGDSGEFGASIRALCRSQNMGLLLSCEPGSRSYEFPELKHGLFTASLIQAFDNKEALRDSVGAIWLSSIGRQLKSVSKALLAKHRPSHSQVPQTFSDDVFEILLDLKNPEGTNIANGQFAAKLKAINATSAAATSFELGMQLIDVRPDLAYAWIRLAYTMSPADSRYALMFALVSSRAGYETTATRIGNRFPYDENPDIYQAILASGFGFNRFSTREIYLKLKIGAQNLQNLESPLDILVSIEVLLLLVENEHYNEDDFVFSNRAGLSSQFDKHKWPVPYLSLQYLDPTEVNYAQDATKLLQDIFSHTISPLIRSFTVRQVHGNLSYAGLIDDMEALLTRFGGQYVDNSTQWKNNIRAIGFARLGAEQSIYDYSSEDIEHILSIVPETLTGTDVLYFSDLFLFSTAQFLSQIRQRFDPKDDSITDQLASMRLYLFEHIVAVMDGTRGPQDFERGKFDALENQMLDSEFLRELQFFGDMLVNGMYGSFEGMLADPAKYADEHDGKYWHQITSHFLSLELPQIVSLWSPYLDSIGFDYLLWRSYLKIGMLSGNAGIAYRTCEYFIGEEGVAEVLGRLDSDSYIDPVSMSYRLLWSCPADWGNLDYDPRYLRVPLLLDKYHNVRPLDYAQYIVDEFEHIKNILPDGTFDWDTSGVHGDHQIGESIVFMHLIANALQNSTNTEDEFDEWRELLEANLPLHLSRSFDPIAVLLYGYALAGIQAPSSLRVLADGLATLPYSMSAYSYPTIVSFWMRVGAAKTFPESRLLGLFLNMGRIYPDHDCEDVRMFSGELAFFDGAWNEPVTVGTISEAVAVEGTMNWRVLSDGSVTGTLKYDGGQWLLTGKASDSGWFSGELFDPNADSDDKPAIVFGLLPPKDDVLPEGLRGLPVVLHVVSKHGVGKISAIRRALEIAKGGTPDDPHPLFLGQNRAA